MVAGPQLHPKRRPSPQDALAPIGRPRRLVRETWTPPGSAPQASPDRAQSALPTAAIARESVQCIAAFAGPAPGLARLVAPTGSEAKPRTTHPRATGKAKSACPIEA